ncbi:hypothetical protein NDN08_001089 [Rhodosorus marinus]|uniref:Uncharacterized protein n=1 Tax=Rhodosorus marinus TaxID=101924 RepID=A0AAV8UVI3_9RHOD|nr:hypothetical protein NDN08_001089 [Rhodosorus marinus]
MAFLNSVFVSDSRHSNRTCSSRNLQLYHVGRCCAAGALVAFHLGASVSLVESGELWDARGASYFVSAAPSVENGGPGERPMFGGGDQAKKGDVKSKICMEEKEEGKKCVNEEKMGPSKSQGPASSETDFERMLRTGGTKIRSPRDHF